MTDAAVETTVASDATAATTAAPTTSENIATTTTTSTTIAATTTPPSTTPPPPTATDLVLRADGIGPLDFGMPVAAVVAVLDGALGGAESDEVGNYPTADGPYWVNADDVSFSEPYGRTVCYPNGLCAQFGASDPAALAFVGWQQGEPTGSDPGLMTATGVTSGSLWADNLDSMEVDEGGCFSSGSGRVDGVEMVVMSVGEMFGSFTDAGGYVATTPDPADVRVVVLIAGVQPADIYADC